MGSYAQHRASLERVLTHLEQATGHQPRFEGGQYKTLCPAHEDRTPSLTVKYNDASEATFIHCHGGCTGNKPHADPRPVLDKIGLKPEDLFDKPRDKASGTWRGVSNLADRRRQRDEVKPAKYAVPDELAPRIHPKIAKSKKPAPTAPPHVEAWNLYQHPETLDIDWAAIRIVTPLEGGGYDKAFFYVHRDERARGKRICLGENPLTGKKKFEALPDGWASKLPVDPTRQTLFFLGHLRDDVNAGRTIYVVEGESDTVAARIAGLAATTAPKGAGKWQAHHSAELVGADVVIVADADNEGIQGAETVARSLVGKARSIKVVQACVGKDMRDHLEAGYGPDDLVEIDLGIPELHPDRARAAAAELPDSGESGTPESGSSASEHDDHADAPGPNFIDDPDAPNERPTYLLRHGELVERTWRTEGRGEDAVYRARYKSILGCAAWVTEVTEEDDGEERGRYEASTRDLVLQLERRSRENELLEGMTLRLPLEWMKTGEWVGHWPWPDTILGRKRADVDKAVAAIHQAKTAPTKRTKVYIATGWRNTETGPIFIHGGGAIGHGGHLDVDVDLDAVLARTAMPEPTDDAATLRKAYWHGTDPLRQLPARISAPLRGLVFASLIAPIEMVTHLHGPKGTKKTAGARLHVQHFAPGMRFDRGVKEMMSGSSNTSSVKGMARMLGRAKDILLEIDDLAPDRGGAAEARIRLAELARSVYNRSAGTKANYKPGQVVNELPPRCSLLTTGEIVADGSAGSRCLNIAIEAGVITDKLMNDLEAGSRVDARGVIGASYIMWVAQRRDELMTWRDELRGLFLGAWRSTLQDMPYTSDILSRISEAARDYTVGELLFLTFLLDRKAITEDEAAEMWEWSVTGIREAVCAVDAETSDVAANIIWTIKDLLATGRAHLTDRRGGAPTIPGDDMAPQRWGYTAQQRPTVSLPGQQPEVMWRENGARLGAISADRVYLIPAEVEFQARQHRTRAERPWTETTSSMASALDTRGWLATHIDRKSGKKHRSVGREVYGGTQRVWDLPRELFDHFDDDGGDGKDDLPTPLDPLLTRRLGWLELPLLDSADDQVEQQLPAAVGFDSRGSQAAGRGEAKPSLQSVATAPATTPTRPVPPVTPDSAEKAARPAAPHTGSKIVDPEWTLRLMVLDVDGVYLPQQDGQVHTIPLTEPPTALDIAEFADGFGLRHGSKGVGHVYLSPRLSDHFGLVVDDDLTELVEKLGLNQRTDLKDKKSRRNVAAREQLAERGAGFVDELRAAGWEIKGSSVRPRFTIRKVDPDAPEDSGRMRVFTVVLEAYSYMWESKEDDPSGPDQRRFPLPDPDEEPVAYCNALAARLGRAGELLDVPWQWSAASTGAELMARLPVRMKKIPGTDKFEDSWREQGPELVPNGVLHNSRIGGQGMWEPHNKWSRTPLESELATATELWLFDERGSYLPRAASLQAGYGQPEQIDPADLVALLRNGKTPYGLSLIDLPSWNVSSLMPPHPDMPSDDEIADGHVNRRWTTLRTPWLLANAHKHSEFDLADGLDEAIVQAWFWPKTHRIFGGWADKVRNMRIQAGEQAQHAAEQASAATDAGEKTMWEAEIANWRAVELMSKGVYSGYIGKLGSRRSKDASEAYRYHYRPVAQASIWGEQRVMAWIKLAKYAKTTGISPLFASGTDSYGYLAPALDGVLPMPDEDDGRFGKLRVKQKVTLTDNMREQLLQGTAGYQVLDLELARLARGGENT